jgi:hypothetical protein
MANVMVGNNGDGDLDYSNVPITIEVGTPALTPERGRAWVLVMETLEGPEIYCAESEETLDVVLLALKKDLWTMNEPDRDPLPDDPEEASRIWDENDGVKGFYFTIEEIPVLTRKDEPNIDINLKHGIKE